MQFLNPHIWARKIFIGGWRTTARRHLVIEASTRKTLGVVGTADVSDVIDAVAEAVSAQPRWESQPAESRAALLQRAGQALNDARLEVTEWLIREGGGTREKAAFEIDLAVRECFAASGAAIQPQGEVLTSDSEVLSYTHRAAAGIVTVIAPYNAPLQLAMRSVAPALALGNAVILKPDPRTSVSGGVVLARVFESAGLPAGLLAVLPGGSEVGEAAIEHPDVTVVSFTGSTIAGRAVGKLAAQHLKRAHLELGGNSALIVVPGVNLDWAARLGARGSFFHQGQICMAVGRHLVHEDIAEAYTAKLVKIARTLRVGDPWKTDVDLGPLIDEHQRDRVHEMVRASVRGGATLAQGGTYDELHYQPTVMTDVAASTPAYCEEVFGPVAAIRTYSNIDEGIKMAADSDYGLSLSVLSSDISIGRNIAEKVPTGIVHINDQTIADSPFAPMGGLGDSGNGARFGGRANIDLFTDVRWVTVRAATK